MLSADIKEICWL